MLLTILALVVGVAIGLGRGGQFENLRHVQIRLPGLLVAGVLIQLIALNLDVPARASILVIGSFALIVGLGANLRVGGTGIVMVGTLANLAVLVANGHVPTKLEALTGAGLVAPGTDPMAIVINDGLGQLQGPDTALAWLGDIIPFELFGSSFLTEVLSFGDLIVLAGLVALAANLLLTSKRTGITVDELLGPVEVDLRDPILDLTEPAFDDSPVGGGERSEDWAGWGP